MAEASPKKMENEWTGFKAVGGLLLILLMAAQLAYKNYEWGESTFGIWQGALFASALLLTTLLFVCKSLSRWIATPFFALVNLFVLTVGTLLGTFIPQNGPPPNYQEMFGTFWGKVVVFCSLHEIYYSWWFVAAFILLALSLLTVSLLRKKYRNNWSFLLAHLSIVLIFVGVWTDFFYGLRGIMHLEVGKKENNVQLFWRNTNLLKDKKTLDFKVRLDSFSSEKFAPDYRIQLWRKGGGKPEIVTTFPLQVGKKQKIFGTAISLSVNSFYPNHTWSYIENETQIDSLPEDPILIGKIKTVNGEQKLQMRANYEGYNSIHDPYGFSNIEFTWGLKPEHKTILAQQKATKEHTISWRNPNNHEKETKGVLNVRVGQRFNIPESNYSLYVNRFYDDLQYDPITKQYTNGVLHNGNPALQLTIYGPGIKKKVYISAKHEVNENMELTEIQERIGLEFMYTFNSGNGLLFVGKERDVYRITQDAITKDSLLLNYPYLFEGRQEAYFQIMHLFPNARGLVSVPKKENDSLVNPLATVSIDYGDQVLATHHLVPPKGRQEALVHLEGAPYFLALASTRQMETKYWKSRLSILNAAGQVVKEGNVQVNTPFIYKGYRFYQTDFDPNRPTYSGIGVSREPGLYVIYLGFVLLLCGVGLMFYSPKLNRTND